MAALGKGHWKKTTRGEIWRERIESLTHCGNARCDLILLQSRELLEHLRNHLVKVNEERKQERIAAWKNGVIKHYKVPW